MAASFTGTLMKVDCKIDYMNYLGWTFTHIPTGKTVPYLQRKPGSHNVQGDAPRSRWHSTPVN